MKYYIWKEERNIIGSISTFKQTNSSLHLENKKNKSNKDDEIKSLQNQEDDLKKQLQQVRSSNEDLATKQVSIKSLENKIEQIDSQIQADNVTASDNNNNNDNNNIKTKSSDQDTLISSFISYKQINTVNSVRKSIKGRVAELRSDAALDAGSGTGESAKSENNEADKDDAIENALGSKIGKLSSNIVRENQNKNSSNSKAQTSKVNEDKTSIDPMDIKSTRSILQISKYKKGEDVKNDTDKTKSIDVSVWFFILTYEPSYGELVIFI